MESRSFQWDDLRVLLAVHRAGSFLAAGQALGVSTSTVARRIQAIEAHLDVVLVRRAADGSTLEPAAAGLVALAEQMEAKLGVAARDLSHAEARLAGTVRVSLGEGFVAYAARVLAEVRRAHPEIQLELVAEARSADLGRREADIGIRTVRGSSDAVIVRRVGDLVYGVYGSEGYLAAAASARVPQRELSRHDFVGYEGFLEKQPEMRWLRERGATRFPFRASTTDGLLHGALCDQGLAALPDLLAREHPRLVRLKLGEDPPAKAVHLAMPRELETVPRVRVCFDALCAAFTDALTTKRRAPRAR
jgi:DNA-binding transcriptional LysR family regulator